MRDLSVRTIMGWIFALEAALSIPTAIWANLHTDRASFGTPFRGIFLLLCLSMSIIVFAVASLTVLKGWRSGSLWGVAASALFVLLYFMPLASSEKFVWWHALGDLFFGLSGLVAFTRPFGAEMGHSDEHK